MNERRDSADMGPWYPALHLWWRFTWRILLFSLLLGALAGVLRGWLGFAPFPGPGELRPGMTPSAWQVGGVLLYGLVLVLAGIWIFKAWLFTKPFEGKGIGRVCFELNTPMGWRTATILWWAMTWRSFLLQFPLSLLVAALGVFLAPAGAGPDGWRLFTEQAVVSASSQYIAFVWMLARLYGRIRLAFSPCPPNDQSPTAS